MHKNVVTIRLPVNFKGSYTKDAANFPLRDNLISQKTACGVDRVLNFKDF